MLPFRPSTQALSRVFSFSSMLVSTLIAFSAPPGCLSISHIQKGLRSGAYPKFNGHGEEVAASLLGNFLATWNAWEVNKAGLDKAFLALHGPDDLLGKAASGQLQP